MQLNPHLSFNGQCEMAFKFYEKTLGGKISAMLSFADSPMAAQTSPDWRTKILHATLLLGDQRLTGGDVPPDSYQRSQGLAVLLNLGPAAEADRIFAALSDNGVVQVSMQETFWAMRLGAVVDQFGTPWLIQCGRSGAI